MKMLITGANGMVAKAAINHCLDMGDVVLSYTRQELDISNADTVLRTIGDEKPDAVLNCAAYTNVDGAEENREACFASNAFGVENLAKAAKHIGCKFLTISTDYVFDGKKEGFYTQENLPNPQGVYAESKLDGEIRALRVYDKSIIVRTGWIFGLDGANFLSVMGKLLSEGKTIKAISNSYGTLTYADDLAKRLRELIVLEQCGVFHVSNGGSGVSYLDFALKVCEIGGYDKSLVQSVSFDELDRQAERPKNSRLRCVLSEKMGLPPLPNWKEALKRFMQ